MKNKLILVVLSVTTFIAGGVFMHAVMINSISEFSCTARYTTQLNNVQIRLINKMVFYKDKGTMTYNGEVVENHVIKSVIDRKVNFSYVRDKKGYFLHNDEISVFSDDDSDVNVMKNHLPDFFVLKGASIDFDIFTLGYKKYMFTSGRTPFFYCSE